MEKSITMNCCVFFLTYLFSVRLSKANQLLCNISDTINEDNPWEFIHCIDLCYSNDTKLMDIKFEEEESNLTILCEFDNNFRNESAKVNFSDILILLTLHSKSPYHSTFHERKKLIQRIVLFSKIVIGGETN